MVQGDRTLPPAGTQTLEACLLERGNLEAILDAVADGIFTIDERFRITQFNRAAEEITGFSRDEALSMSCLEIFRQILFGQECLVCKAIEKEEYVRLVEREITRKDDRRRLVLVTTTPMLDRGGRRAGVVVVFRDIQELRELTEQAKGRSSFEGLIGKNHRMRQIYQLIEQVADSTASVLIEGESGTGKELVAKAIHKKNHRANKPFVAVSCAALAESLLESELFGHVKGAFTGAVTAKVGRFELADGGTLFLDEISDISPTIQVKLLRVLQEHTFERVGESRPRTVDVRIIAATNRDLRHLIAEGKFREDLFYRLKVVPVSLPPLRERTDDIPLLVAHFVERFRKDTGKPITGVTPDAMSALLDYPWPGNVRELENAIEHAFVRGAGTEIALAHLPREVRGVPRQPQAGSEIHTRGPEAAPDRAAPTPTEPSERERIIRALNETGWDRTAAARRLGLSRVTLWRKIREYGIVPRG
jgi:PAS domain S-box-containing protein